MICKTIRKKIAKRAMEAIATNKEQYSCLALEFDKEEGVVVSRSLSNEYANFYEKSTISQWDPELPAEYFNVSPTQEQINWRLTLLALFNEVGMEGLE